MKQLYARLTHCVDKYGWRDAFHQLLPLSDLQSLLLKIFYTRCLQKTPKEILRVYRENRFVKPATCNPLHSAQLDMLTFQALPPQCIPLELSPVLPLGSHTVLASVHPDRVLPTIRMTELIADAAQALAMESIVRSGLRLREEPLWLAASHRLLRTQLFDEPAAFPHFRMFSLAAAGRKTGRFGFERIVLKEILSFLSRWTMALRYANFDICHVRISIRCRTEALYLFLIDHFKDDHLFELQIVMDSNENWSYYDSFRIHIYMGKINSQEIFIGDGGTLVWIQKLTSDLKNCYFNLGLGTERLLYLFGPQPVKEPV